MNTITLLDTNYLHANRTIESYLLSNKKDEKLVFIYNYKGVHFRLFLSLSQLMDFFNEKGKSSFEFGNENKLDRVLEKLNFND